MLSSGPELAHAALLEGPPALGVALALGHHPQIALVLEGDQSQVLR